MMPGSKAPFDPTSSESYKEMSPGTPVPWTASHILPLSIMTPSSIIAAFLKKTSMVNKLCIPDPEKAPSSIVVTESGTVRLDIDLLLLNAPEPIVVHEPAIVTDDLPAGTSINLVLAALYKHPSELE